MPDSYIFYISDFSPYIACYWPLLQNFLICDNNKIFCVVFVNGKFCKYLALVTINDFSFFVFNVSRNIANKVGSNDTHLIIDKLLGLSIRLDLHLRIHICVSFLFFSFPSRMFWLFSIEQCIRALFTGPTNFTFQQPFH